MEVLESKAGNKREHEELESKKREKLKAKNSM